MKLSARNQLKGKITEIVEGTVSALVVVDLGQGNTISSHITLKSAKELGLKVGDEATVIIKSSDVMIGVE